MTFYFLVLVLGCHRPILIYLNIIMDVVIFFPQLLLRVASGPLGGAQLPPFWEHTVARHIESTGSRDCPRPRSWSLHCSCTFRNMLAQPSVQAKGLPFLHLSLMWPQQLERMARLLRCATLSGPDSADLRCIR
eukprot:COSAG01_NODE_6154_length_3821_cov_1.639441_4_plen_133_part_00